MVTAWLGTQGTAGHGIRHPQRRVSIFPPMASGGAVHPVLPLKKWLEPEWLTKPTQSLGATSLYHLSFPQEHENLCSIFVDSQQSLFKANSECAPYKTEHLNPGISQRKSTRIHSVGAN